ncbi:CDP-alcohol phosphatidyltransferase family protein [Gammaproteobacteria bacterium]|nr:CDP-alcohol phosphatidyltransferase family protein [Gammaproteobacteria bacterium]
MNYLIHALTFSRFLAGPIIFYLLLYSDQYYLVLAIFIFAGLSDYFDGHLARKYSLESEIGEILDPIADKILTLFLVIALAEYLNSHFIAFTGALMISREFWVSGLRDYNSRNNNIKATSVSALAKLKTATQFISFSLFLLGIASGMALITFFANFVLFLSMLLSFQTGLAYTQASFKKSA